MALKYSALLLSFIFFVALHSLPAQAQFNTDSYEDYGAFSTDPVDLDNEVNEMLGRFFQSSFHLGTGVLTGGLGTAYSAGVVAEVKFVFFFDRIWAAELGAGFSRTNGLYNQEATNPQSLTTIGKINLELSTNLIPLSFGIRYGFDLDRLPRGLSTMNPYFSVNGELLFRSEYVVGEPVVDGLTATQKTRFGTGAVNSTTAFGIDFGGGIEFDVYKKKLFLGLDLRYHLLFWPDTNTTIGAAERSGNWVTLLGTATYNY